MTNAPGDTMADAMGWHRPLIRTPEEKKRTMDAITAGLKAAGRVPPRRPRQGGKK